MDDSKNGMEGCNILGKTNNDDICESFKRMCLRVIFVILGQMVGLILN